MLYTTNSQVRKVRKIKLTFLDSTGKTLEIAEFFPWATVADVKSTLQKKVRLKKVRLFYKNLELLRPNGCLSDFNMGLEALIVVFPYKSQQTSGILNPYAIFDNLPQRIQHMLRQAQIGLLQGIAPRLTLEGTSGTYFLHSAQKQTIAVFKPYDEQPYAPNNPKGIKGKLGTTGIRQGILSGQSATRQVAAYLLDQKGFHRVPATTYIQFSHPSFKKQQEVSIPLKGSLRPLQKQINTKHGSFQQFIRSKDVAANYSYTMFSVQQVHKLGILDIRIINCDRNQGNILLLQKKSKQKKNKSKQFFFVPIDHGLSFPSVLPKDFCEPAWLQWPQSHSPFSKASKQFIQNLDPERDANMLRDKLGFRQICLRNFRMAEILLKKGVRMSMTLFEIGSFLFIIDQYDKKTQMQRVLQMTQNLVNSAYVNNYNPIRNKAKKSLEIVLEEPKEEGKEEESKRGISLPSRRNKGRPDFVHKRKKNENGKAQLHNKDEQQSPTIKRKVSNDLFFHYFQRSLQTKIQQKLKTSKKRERFNSQCFE